MDDSVPGQLDPITPDRRGTFGLGGATGYNPTPKGTAIGACCIDDTCLLLSRNACVSQGGIYQGDDTECNPDPCAVPAIPVSWGGLKFANR